MFQAIKLIQLKSRVASYCWVGRLSSLATMCLGVTSRSGEALVALMRSSRPRDGGDGVDEAQGDRVERRPNITSHRSASRGVVPGNGVPRQRDRLLERTGWAIKGPHASPVVPASIGVALLAAL